MGAPRLRPFSCLAFQTWPLKATMPGVPDFYQGTELWDLTLVDPDNRRRLALKLTEEGRLNSALLIEDSAADSRESWRKIYERFPVYGLSEYSRPKATARTLSGLPHSGHSIVSGL